jgi:hypothetical protein
MPCHAMLRLRERAGLLAEVCEEEQRLLHIKQRGSARHAQANAQSEVCARALLRLGARELLVA